MRLWRLRWSIARAVLAEPRLWLGALRQVRVMARPRWWRRPPFLPLPPADYAAFRWQTMYGGSGLLTDEVTLAASHRRAGEDLAGWLRWSGEEHAAQRLRQRRQMGRRPAQRSVRARLCRRWWRSRARATSRSMSSP